MVSFYIEQFGCRATQADAAAIERQLLAEGLAVCGERDAADLVIVNTCTVTGAADQQARQAIAEIQRKNPAARIIVTGCYAQRAPEEVAQLPGVSCVVGNSHRPEIPRVVRQLASGAGRGQDGFVPVSRLGGGHLTHPPFRAEILAGDIREQRGLLPAPVDSGANGHTRPVLKIQDGCDKRCSYCVIPQVRGRSRSLAPSQVIKEIEKLRRSGAREIVLSGIDLGNYGRDLTPRSGLIELLRQVLAETTIERLRVSSVEPMDVTADLIGIFVANGRMARHFHLPMQSGCDRILAGMHRWYRAEHYARRVELIRESLPDAAIGADVITGFPGETDGEHRQTIALIERLPLTYLHVFSFSPRPGTAAADLSGAVPESVVTRRARELRALGEEKKAAFRREQLGKRIRVLTLNGQRKDASGPWTRALSDNYLDLRVHGKWPPNRVIEVEITRFERGYLRAETVAADQQESC